MAPTVEQLAIAFPETRPNKKFVESVQIHLDFGCLHYILMKNKNPTGIFWIFDKKILWKVAKKAVRDGNRPERLTENS